MSRSHVSALIDAGKLPGINMGKGDKRRRMEVPESAVDEYLKQKRKKKSAKAAVSQTEMFSGTGVEKLLETAIDLMRSIDKRLMYIEAYIRPEGEDNAET